MNNRIDGITIIVCLLLTLTVTWIESASFGLSDRLAFVVLSGFAALQLASMVYAKVSAPVAQVTPQAPDRQSVPAEVSPEFKAELEEFETQLDAQISEIEAHNPAVMTETELFHRLADIASQAEIQPEEVQPIVLEVPPVEVPKKTRSRAAAKTKSSAATVTVKAEGDTKVEPAAKAKKTRSTTARKTTTSSKRSSKKSGALE